MWVRCQLVSACGWIIVGVWVIGIGLLDIGHRRPYAA
jgi:hypothetical protein